MIYYGALAGARNAELIEQTVQIARRDPKLPPAQTLPFLEQAARESGDPDRVWRLVFTHRNDILGTAQRACSGNRRCLASRAHPPTQRWHSN